MSKPGNDLKGGPATIFVTSLPTDKYRKKKTTMMKGHSHYGGLCGGYVSFRLRTYSTAQSASNKLRPRLAHSRIGTIIAPSSAAAGFLIQRGTMVTEESLSELLRSRADIAN
ncbi:hypothetical protein J3459_007982 [Metarhizium acridum]|nr:hypothetical protein J3459_007982 [Metarhizium acridum]